MIELNLEELIALNTVIDNVPIYGIKLINKNEQVEEIQRVNNVVSSLQEKEVMIGEEFTDKGLIVLKLLEIYKTSSIHIFINKIRVAPINENDVVVIEIKNDDLFILSKVNKITLEKIIIESSEFLRQGSVKRFIPYPKIKMSKLEFQDEIDNDKWSEVILVQKHNNKILFLNKLYFMNENEGYCFDYIAEEKVQKEPRDIRMDLMRILEIKED